MTLLGVNTQHTVHLICVHDMIVTISGNSEALQNTPNVKILTKRMKANLITISPISQLEEGKTEGRSGNAPSAGSGRTTGGTPWRATSRGCTGSGETLLSTSGTEMKKITLYSKDGLDHQKYQYSRNRL